MNIEIVMKKIKSTIAACLMLATGIVTVSCGGTLGSVLSTVGSGGTIANVITSVIGMDKLTQRSLIGNWTYSGPGCAFTSENLLAKAGGEVAATKIEQELQPYYDRIGLSSSNTRITFNEDQTFSAVIAGKSLSGTYTFDEANSKITMKTLLFSFNCFAKREYSGISLLFESKKLLTVLQTVAMMSGNDTYQKIGELSKNYDGVRLGFDMR